MSFELSDELTKIERSKNRNSNFIAKSLRDQGDRKGAFKLRVVNPKKGEYKRERINVKDFDNEYQEED